MSGSMVRIGVVGLDHWYTALTLVQRIAAHPGCQLAGVADDDAAHAEEAARQAGRPEVATTDARRLLDDPSIDIIASFISTDRNPAVCIAAAEHGKHVLSIKPLAMTLEDAERIAAAVHTHGVHFLPAESRGRLSAQSQTLKRWVGEGRFGRLLTASFSLWSALPQRWPGDRDPGWFADPARCPGGAWIDHSIYSLDHLRWLLGEEVTSIGGTVATLNHPGLPVEDYGVATVTFGGGAVATIEDTWHRPGAAFRTAQTLVGTEGALTQDSVGGWRALAGVFPDLEGWVQIRPEGGQNDGLDHLIALCRGDAEPVATVEDAQANLAACLAFYEAASTGATRSPAAPQTTGSRA